MRARPELHDLQNFEMASIPCTITTRTEQRQRDHAVGILSSVLSLVLSAVVASSEDGLGRRDKVQVGQELSFDLSTSFLSIIVSSLLAVDSLPSLLSRDDRDSCPLFLLFESTMYLSSGRCVEKASIGVGSANDTRPELVPVGDSRRVDLSSKLQ